MYSVYMLHRIHKTEDTFDLYLSVV